MASVSSMEFKKYIILKLVRTFYLRLFIQGILPCEKKQTNKQPELLWNSRAKWYLSGSQNFNSKFLPQIEKLHFKLIFLEVTFTFLKQNRKCQWQNGINIVSKYMVYHQSLFFLSLFKRENKGSDINDQKQGWCSILPLSFGFLLIAVSSPASK